MTNKNLAVVILTHNESMHIQRSIESVKSIASEIFVIDSGSKDQTVKIAEENGAVVLHHSFVNYAKQFQWALDNAPITADWTMRLDADEIIELDLQEEIQAKLHHLPMNVVGVNLKRKHIFMNRWVKHGGRYPLVLLRIWRTGHGRIEDRWMDEHMVISGGETVTFKGGFADHNLNDLTFFTDKHNKYATREAIDVINQKLNLFARDESLNTESASFQASIKRIGKEKIYNKIPFTIAAFSYFIYRYIFQLGFLDGRSGLVYHFLQGYWYRFLVGAKIMELEKAIEGMSDKKEILKEISRLTGHKLADD
ncbi:glycosyltransferase family 2 protein [Acinetobacter sp. YH16040_T]|uniref:glycosyltransferase family 2 protein n=1 Tax=unclassified Acinetobacter TaxID=196816 RepID=UPI0015D2C2A4|nr:MULTISPECIES: glycosyltransferase family 2 protein [unclassified Acinetobacter]UUS57560.1 glycosyltransferase family 2 protein [Acinetobacter sp. YH16040_T]